MIIHLDSVDSRDKAAKLVGKTVVFTTPGKKELKGTVASAHGNSGAIRVIFETGMPGQSLGQKVAVQ
jgi:large subunit ribosomal protein L35Ae